MQSDKVKKKNSLIDKPLITIITVVLNGAKTLEQCITSVINQRVANYEYIIIDGKSCDGSLDIIKKYEDFISCWISESDRGIYDAMNKGISLARGEWIYFLNSDDYFLNEIATLKAEEYIYSLCNTYKIFYGNVFIVNRSNEVIGKRDLDYDARMFNCNGYMLPHQGIFAHKSLFEVYQGFDIQFKYGADYDWLVRVLKKERIKHILEWDVACMFDGGVSTTSVHKMKLEYLSIMRKYNNAIAFSFWIYLLRIYMKKILEHYLSESAFNFLCKNFKTLKRLIRC